MPTEQQYDNESKKIDEDLFGINFDSPIEKKKVICAICKKEINVPIDRIYFIEYGEFSSLSFMNKRSKKGKICHGCCSKIDKFVMSMKKK